MQEKEKKTKYLPKRVVSFLLAFSLVLTTVFVRPPKAEAIVIEGLGGEVVKAVVSSFAVWAVEKLADAGYDVVFGTDKYDEVTTALAGGEYGGGVGRTTVTNSDIARSLSFHLSDSTLSSLQDSVDSGFLESFSYDTNNLDFVIGKYRHYSSNTGYSWDPMYSSLGSSWTSDSFYIHEDGEYLFNFPQMLFRTHVYSNVGYYYRYYISKYYDDSWVAVSTISMKPASSTSVGVLSDIVLAANTKTVPLEGGFTYRVSASFPQNVNTYDNNGFLNGADGFFHLFPVSVISTTNTTYVPVDTRPVGLADAITQYNNSVDNSTNYTNYFIGTTDENGDVIEVYDFNIFDESTMTIQNPASGDTWTATSWEYDYPTRSYYCTLENGQYVRITYGDEYVTIIYPDENGNYYEQNYYYVTAEYTVPENPDEPVCDHVFLSDTTIPPTCTESGWRSYTCFECGYVYNTSILAKGHDWVEVETVPPVTDEDGDVIEAGYTTFECSACGETTTTYNGAIPDSGVPPVEDESWFKWITDLFKKLIESIVNGLSSALEWVIEHLVMTVVDWLTRAADWVFGLFDTESLGLWFNWFEDGSALDEEFTQYDENGKEMEVDVWA